MTSPLLSTEETSAVLSIVKIGDWVIGISLVSVSGVDSVESAVTVLVKLPPASISDWVTVWLQE